MSGSRDSLGRPSTLAIPLAYIVEGMSVYKVQWLEILAATKLKYQKKQEAGRKE